MRVELKVDSDSHNTNCDYVEVGFNICEEYVYVDVEGRVLGLKKDEFKKLLMLL